MKLFALEETKEELEDHEVTSEEPIDRLDIEETIDEYKSDLGLVTEEFRKAYYSLENVYEVQRHFNSRRLASPEYFITLEDINLYLKNITNNLGIKTKLPSLEDFKNPYSTKVCHEITQEGFFSVIRSIWEKIKEFFRAFFKKVMLFFKRLTKADLDLQEYEEYLERAIARVKGSKQDNAKGEIIRSKLPTLIAYSYLSNMINTKYVLEMGLEKFQTLTKTCNEVNGRLNELVKEVTRTIKDEYLSHEIDYILTNSNDIRERLFSSLTNEINKVLTSYSSISSLPSSALYIIDDEFSYAKELDGSDPVKLLINFVGEDTKLPNNFNIMFTGAIVREENEYVVFATSYDNKNNQVPEEIKTIENKRELLRVYEFYKKFGKDFNISSADRALNGISKDLDRLLDDLEKIDRKILELQGKNKSPSEMTDKDIDDFVRGIRYSYQRPDENRIPKENHYFTIGFLMGRYFLENGEKLRSLFDDVQVADFMANVITAIVTDNKEDLNELVGNRYNYYMRDIFQKALIILKREGEPQNSSAYIDPDSFRNYNKLNKFLMSYINTLQKLINIISTELYSSYLTSRYELLKYIFKSAELFKD